MIIFFFSSIHSFIHSIPFHRSIDLVNIIIHHHVFVLSSASTRLADSSSLTSIVLTSPDNLTNPGLAPFGLETCRHRTAETLTRPTRAALLNLAARSAASRKVASLGVLDLITTWLPGQPAACIHHSFGSFVGSKETMSLSSDVRPTRISTVVSSFAFEPSPKAFDVDEYAKYGRRGRVF